MSIPKRTAYIAMALTIIDDGKRLSYGTHGFIGVTSDKLFTAMPKTIFTSLGMMVRKTFISNVERYNAQLNTTDDLHISNNTALDAEQSKAAKGFASNDGLPFTEIEACVINTGIVSTHPEHLIPLESVVPLAILESAGSLERTDSFELRAKSAIKLATDDVIRKIGSEVDEIVFFVRGVRACGYIKALQAESEVTVKAVPVERETEQCLLMEAAKVNLLLAKYREIDMSTPISKPVKAAAYWTERPEVHPLVSQRYTIFATHASKPYQYGVECKDLYDFGKRGSLTGYSVVKTNVDIINEYKNRVIADAKQRPTVAYVLTNTFKSPRSNLNIRFGLDTFQEISPGTLEYQDVGNGSLVGGTYNPPGMSLRGWTILEDLQKLLDGYIEGGYSTEGQSSYEGYSMRSIDVTDRFYDDLGSNKVKLKATLKPGVKFIKLPPPEGSGRCVRYVIGKDTPSRNDLARITNDVTVKLITFTKEAQVRFALIFDCKDAVGIYSNWCCNVMFSEIRSVLEDKALEAPSTPTPNQPPIQGEMIC